MTDEIINSMNEHEETNTLARDVEAGRWGRRKTMFKPLTSEELQDFPEMTEKDLKIFLTGTYQLK